jgi:P4 family phage/plasmid primase-like protien
MNNQLLITDKERFLVQATDFFNLLFEPALEQMLGEIELRLFAQDGKVTQRFFNSEAMAAEEAYEYYRQGMKVCFGVNLRVEKEGKKGGKKDNVRWVSAFHAEIDYGTLGHDAVSKHATRESALDAIHAFNLAPTIVIHSGGGFHCYWVLFNPLNVKEVGLERIESVNKALSVLLGGDSATDISRVLRVPGTFNMKIPENPRPVTIESCSCRKYQYEDFMHLIRDERRDEVSSKQTVAMPWPTATNPIDADSLPISEKIKSLIKQGNRGQYVSRSHADFAVITTLVHKGLSDSEIRQVFLQYPIGEKYRQHKAPDQYLKHSIDKAKKLSNLTPDELTDPLFVSESLSKTERGYQLDAVKFEEYIIRKYDVKYLDKETMFFQYNGKCYAPLTENALNFICQRELGIHRMLFPNNMLKQLIHFAKGDALMDSAISSRDHISYLTLQNGLYKVDTGELLPHSPSIFTTNLLPYNYDPQATCPRFMQFLDEVFLGDKEKIQFIQEAVGYTFHKSIPTAAMFFLVGGGSNGKSVFINTISSLVGEDNFSNISFSSLSDERYILKLYQKMINITGETPQSKRLNTDTIKAVVGGDWVTGRELYKEPMTFRPYAKHFLAMNKAPMIEDTSHGMWRRIWIVEFPRRFEEHEMDRELEDKLRNELSGIFNWALEGYRRLKGRRFSFPESDAMKISKSEYRNDMDSIRDYASKYLHRSDSREDRLIFKDVYDSYVAFCQNEGKKEIEAKKDFGKRLQDMHYKVTESTRDANKKCVFNVRWAKE